MEDRLAQGKALRKAAREGDDAAVRLLLRQKADVNASGSKGFSALMNAAYNGKEATARLLVEAGANREAKTDAGCTALLQACPQLRTLYASGTSVDEELRAAVRGSRRIELFL